MLEKMILELFQKYIKTSNDGQKFILLDDLAKQNFNEDELPVILDTLNNNSIKIKEIYVVKENAPLPEEDFKPLEIYLEERFISSSTAFRKNKESGQVIPTIHLDQVLGLRLKESYLRHAIKYLSCKHIYIRGIRLQEDELLEENLAYVNERVK